MAVYTEVSDDELARFIAGYGLGALLSYKGIAEGVENTNYLIHAEAGAFILTLYEKRVDPNDLPYFLTLMDHLAARGLTCPLPVHDSSGRYLNQLSGRHAALITFLEGVWPRKPRPSHCAEVGKALAQMHVAGRDFPMTRANALGPSGWPPLFQKVEHRADEILPGLRRLISDELAVHRKVVAERLAARRHSRRSLSR